MSGKLQAIKTQKGLAVLLGIKLNQLVYWSYVATSSEKYYFFDVPKKSGGVRAITAPNEYLKSVFRTLKSLLEEIYEPSSVVRGFVKEHSIVTNALSHIDKRHVLNFDLQDFFPSITFPRIRGLLKAKPYELSDAVATTIAQLCCCDGVLPQGAPTSPVIANMICGRLDRDLKQFLRSYKCTYTRYADDITVSTHKLKFPEQVAFLSNPPYSTQAVLGPQLNKLVESNGFKVNPEKTRLQDRQHRQVVTGLVVNKFPNVHRSFVNETRLLLHIWERHGLGDAAESYSQKHLAGDVISDPYFKRVLVGRINYLSMVRGVNDQLYISLAKRIRKLDPDLMRKPLDKLDKIRAAIWVIETDLDKAKDIEAISQGTGVMIDGVGLVTCAHTCIEPLIAYRAEKPSERYRVKVLKLHKHVDLAILKIKAKSPATLKIGDTSNLDLYTPVTIAGYPEYAPGSGIYQHDGHVIQRKTLHGVNHFLVSMPIVKGASGSPVLDKKGDVVGIATSGADNFQQSAASSGEKYGAILIDEISHLLAKPKKKRSKKGISKTRSAK